MDIVLLWAGIGLFVFGLTLLFLENQIRRNQVSADGLIVGYSKGPVSQSGTPMYRAVIGYTGVDGRARLVESQVSGSVPLGFVGKAVQIYLHQDDPDYAEPDRGVVTAIGCGVTFAGAILMAIFFHNVQANYISVGLAAAVSAGMAYQLWRFLRAAKAGDKSVRDSYERSLKSRVFFAEARDKIAWIDTTSMSAVFVAKAKGQRGVIPVLAVVSITGVAFSLFLYKKEAAFLSIARTTQGVVVEMVESRGSKSTTYSPIVEFTPTSAAQSVHFRHRISSNPPSYRVGEAVTVLFDPNQPKSAQIDLGIWNQLGAMISAGIGIFSALLLAHLLKLKDLQNGDLSTPETASQKKTA